MGSKRSRHPPRRSRVLRRDLSTRQVLRRDRQSRWPEGHPRRHGSSVEMTRLRFPQPPTAATPGQARLRPRPTVPDPAAGCRPRNSGALSVGLAWKRTGCCAIGVPRRSRTRRMLRAHRLAVSLRADRSLRNRTRATIIDLRTTIEYICTRIGYGSTGGAPGGGTFPEDTSGRARPALLPS